MDEVLEPGLYETLVTNGLAEQIAALGDGYEADTRPLDTSESSSAFVRHLADVLNAVLRSLPETDRVARQAEISNALLKPYAFQEGVFFDQATNTDWNTTTASSPTGRRYARRPGPLSTERQSAARAESAVDPD